MTNLGVNFNQTRSGIGIGGGVNPFQPVDDAPPPPPPPPVNDASDPSGFMGWVQREYANSALGRAQEVANPGSVSNSPVGQPQEELYGIDGLIDNFRGLERWRGKQTLNMVEAITRALTSQKQVDYNQGLGSRAYSTGDPNASPELTTAQKLAQQANFQRSGRADQDNAYANIAIAEEAAQAPTDWMAEAIAYQNQFAPDYSGIQDRWTNEANATNARMQAMYDQIASRAGENVQRVSDIYSGASQGIGSAYDTASANTQAAYASSQQQATDQMARLGIGAAAPNVLNPAALSQAEAIANLEVGRGSGQAANERFGASAGGFASQMAQVAQQEGAQYQTGVTDELRRQLIGLDMRAQQEAYQRAMQAPGLAQSLEQASRIGEPQGLSFEQQLAQAEFDFRVGQAGANISIDQKNAMNKRYQEIYALNGRNGPDAWEELQWELSKGMI